MAADLARDEARLGAVHVLETEVLGFVGPVLLLLALAHSLLHLALGCCSINSLFRFIV